MKTVTTIAELRDLYDKGSPRALVPTLGALHEGHTSLIRAAKATGKEVVVSIFVNPTQFGQGEDFEKYPRTWEEDLQLAEAAGTDIIFSPSVHEVYPRPGATVIVPQVTETYEGERRPGHFDGVATVVCKLFQMVQPEIAFFGLKDLQQCVVIKRMVEDLNIPLRLSFQPTVREPDGLAKSSRNVYLSREERDIAPVLYATLNSTKDALFTDKVLDSVLLSSQAKLKEAGFSVDYYDVVDLISFRSTREIGDNTAIIAAVRLGHTRLIDNILLSDLSNVS